MNNFFLPNKKKVGLSIIIMPHGNWQWLLAVASIPALIVGIFSFWLPESARYQINCGKSESAIETLEKISEINKIRLPKGRLAIEKEEVRIFVCFFLNRNL